jgi:UDP-GlcNAc:undecaprenyl-phosphate/decaprenyl-phosphate GlcNAc-1-phosphate transferase
MIIWVTFSLALILSLLSIPVVRIYSLRFGWVAKPRPDRWHQKPTPTMGGVAIFLSFMISLLLVGLILVSQADELPPGEPGAGRAWQLPFQQLTFLAGSIFIFGLGLYDDIKQLSPPVKLAGQVIATTIVVTLGYTTNFFTPKLANNLTATVLNIALTIVWLVGVTNAINLLDNMDGLAGSISLITAMVLGALFWRVGNLGLVLVSAALVGSLAGFLFYNFPPAKIFMGDSGSLFLGFTLAVLAIARQPQASNVFAVLGVPTLLFLLPILDMILVSFTRWMRGVSVVQGGRDHTSHRLIAFGLNERQVVWIFSGVAIISGAVAIAIESIGYWLSLIFAPIFVVGLAMIIAYLSGIKIIVSPSSLKTPPRFLGRQPLENGERVLIVGARNAREMMLQWIIMNPQLNYKPVGFIDDDMSKTGSAVQGVVVIGGSDQLEAILERQQASLNPIDGLIICESLAPPENLGVESGSIENEAIQEILTLAKKHGCWVRRLRLEFELLE